MVVGTFVLIGPYVGGLLVWSYLAVQGFGGLAVGIDVVDVLTWPFAGLIGYPFGALPAAMTGTACGFLSGLIRSKVIWVGLSVALGILATVIVLGWSLMFALAGAVAALVSAIVALQVRPRLA